MEIVEKYIGHRIARPTKSRLKRLRRAGENEDSQQVSYGRDRDLDEDNLDADDGLVGGNDLKDLWDDDGTLRARRRDEEPDEEEVDDDDLRGFIEADEDEEENEMGEAERQERLERRRAEKERRRTAGGLTRMAGLDQKYASSFGEFMCI